MGEEGSSNSEFLKEIMNLNRNFQREGGFKPIFGALIFLKQFFLGPRRGNACCGTEEN